MLVNNCLVTSMYVHKYVYTHINLNASSETPYILDIVSIRYLSYRPNVH